MLAWLFEHRTDALVYGAAAIALVVALLVPRAVRVRLRAVLLLVVLFVLVRELAPALFPRLAGSEDAEALAFALGGLAIVRLVFVLVVDLAVERARTRPINALVRDVSQAALYGVIIVTALRAARVQPSSLVAGGTVATAIVGLSLQDTLGNLFAGVSIQLEQGVSVGDWIRIDKGDITGQVVSMSWRAVTVVSDDRALLVIPNGVFARTPYVNYSRAAAATRRNLYFVVPFEFSPTRVRNALLAACGNCDIVLKDPPPSVFTWTFVERGVTYWLRYWVADFGQRDLSQSEVSTRVWYELNRQKIPVSVPVMHTYEHKMNEKAREQHAEEALRDRRDCIDAVDFLRPLAPGSKDLLASRGHRKLFTSGERILRRGEGGRTFYIVRRGQVSISLDGQELRRLGAGDFFGEMALLTGRERTADVTALAETEVLEIDEGMFRDVLRGEPHVAETVSEVLGAREAELAAFRAHGGRPTAVELKTWRENILGKIREVFGI